MAQDIYPWYESESYWFKVIAPGANELMQCQNSEVGNYGRSYGLGKSVLNNYLRQDSEAATFNLSCMISVHLIDQWKHIYINV